MNLQIWSGHSSALSIVLMIAEPGVIDAVLPATASHHLTIRGVDGGEKSSSPSSAPLAVVRDLVTKDESIGRWLGTRVGGFGTGVARVGTGACEIPGEFDTSCGMPLEDTVGRVWVPCEPNMSRSSCSASA